MSGPLEASCESADQPEDEAEALEAGPAAQDGRQLNIDRLLSLDQAILQSVDQCGTCLQTGRRARNSQYQQVNGILSLSYGGRFLPPPRPFLDFLDSSKTTADINRNFQFLIQH